MLVYVLSLLPVQAFSLVLALLILYCNTCLTSGWGGWRSQSLLFETPPPRLSNLSQQRCGASVWSISVVRSGPYFSALSSGLKSFTIQISEVNNGSGNWLVPSFVRRSVFFVNESNRFYYEWRLKRWVPHRDEILASDVVVTSVGFALTVIYHALPFPYKQNKK